MKRIISVLIVCVLALSVVSCTKRELKTNPNWAVSSEATNTVEIVMEDGGSIIVELYPDVAPITVENFKKLVSQNFYDGLIFHRVIANFMIQGGDPTGTGMGGSEESIKGEFLNNGVNNTLSHQRGIISMARSNDPDSASSQFFICHADSTYLDGSYAAFGKVIEGMDVVDEIASVQTDANDKPAVEQKMMTIRFVEEKK